MAKRKEALMLTVKDIPESMLTQIQETFDRDPKVCWLRTQQTLMQRKGRYIEAMKLAKDIEIIYARVVQNILDDAEKATSNIHLDDTGMPEADIESLLECVVTLFMACDIIDTAIIDANDIIKRTDRDLCFDMFNDLSRLAKMAKEKLQFLQNNSGYAKDVVWADKCDNMYDLLRNKARSIIRRRKTDPNWGK